MSEEKKPTKREEIERLISKAAECSDSGDAMRFSQAAVNSANALCALKTAERDI